jgi:hypothetical protein
MTAQVKKQEMTGSDACLMMHTALRKCCDSKITSCVYNLVHLIDVKPAKFDPWRFFGEQVAYRVNAKIPPKQVVEYVYERYRDSFMELLEKAERAGDRPPREAMTWMLALDCALACFTKDDWAEMVEYLGEDI